MSYKFEAGKDRIVNTVVDLIASNIKGKQQALCIAFARRFMSNVAVDDLKEWQEEDLSGAILNYWNLYYQRAPKESKIRIYNPDYERHGWQTTHTVIELVHDDMPFLIDSIRMEINRMGLTSHLIIHIGGLEVTRDAEHQLTDILAQKDQDELALAADKEVLEAAMMIEIDRQTDPAVLHELHCNIERVLADARSVVADWGKMREKISDTIAQMDDWAGFVDKDELTESKDFLAWLEDHHFTFLGLRDYELIKKGKETLLRPIANTGLGVLADDMNARGSRSISLMTPEAQKLTLSSQILVISKTNTISTVHRPIYTDYIGIKRFDDTGKVIGERRLIGLYTSAAYNTNPKHIPFLRRKVALVMRMSKLGIHSHAGKVLQNILDTLPRDDLFQAPEEELLEIAMGIFHMQERRRIRLFARRDLYGRFVSCLVFVPKELFNTELRLAMQKILCDDLNAIESTFSTRFTDSVLARIHFMLKLDSTTSATRKCDLQATEKKLIDVARSWHDEFSECLLDTYGEEEGNRLFNVYGNAFSNAYKESFNARTAVYDIKHIEKIASSTSSLGMSFYRPVGEVSGSLRLKVYQYDESIPLSDVLPILENLGLRILTERPHQLKLNDGRSVWINDFGMIYSKNESLDVDVIKDSFQDAFSRIWNGDADNDGFNQLVLSAGLSWRDVLVLRAYARYFKQIRLPYSQDYIELALVKNPAIARQLSNLFTCRFSLADNPLRIEQTTAIQQDILAAIDQVMSLDEDKILRRYIDAILATLRTNFFQRTEQGEFKSYLSLKFNTSAIPDVPLPNPKYEIFVYSPRFEGVHLRCGKVARGGLRWSDRREDFRTEVLGLMKAQQVKNAVIVPSGAKGGFVPKYLPENGTREEILAEGIACYKRFICGLLDITDNHILGEVVKAKDVYCYDGDDAYLVVAADKGTATFSDIANEISAQYNFWLGDAFASGGSIGYDHKKMGITARGAWESVKRHFREMGKNIQTTDFTVVGIGDMAGDVFGNGMLLSEHIQLIAAFNHLHIFIDPSPDPTISFNERKRLFELPRSAWSDYDETLISKGGGVFSRQAKSIKLTPEIQKCFNISQTTIEPNELIRIILKSEVDLLWSGGIGTFVKAKVESNLDVGDRSNDAIRINADDLRCKVVGEGGNLGLTQLARVAYSLNGGMIYTDFIDNSAGVDCSDNEVNIKILLNSVVVSGDMTDKQRNKLLADMTDEVGKIVLLDNYNQTQAISLAAAQALRNVELHGRYIDDLERKGKLNTSLEFIPDQKALLERKLGGKGLGRPGIAVLLCYSKTLLHDALLQSDVPEEPYLENILVEAFPKPLRKKYRLAMQAHPLKREIIATKLSNIVVNEMGFTFVYRLQDETGASPAAIVRAYMIARTIFSLPSIWSDIQALDNIISSQTQIEMMMQYIRLLRRSTRWFLRANRLNLDIAAGVKLYAPGVEKFQQTAASIIQKSHQKQFEEFKAEQLAKGVPESLAQKLALARPMFSTLDVIDAAQETNVDITDVVEMYFAIGQFLDINWIRTQVIIHPTENHWESLSREALRDDLDWQQRQLTSAILKARLHDRSLEQCMSDWADTYAELIDRWRYILADLRASSGLNITMFFVAIRELLDLTQTTMQTYYSEVEKG